MSAMQRRRLTWQRRSTRRFRAMSHIKAHLFMAAAAALRLHLSVLLIASLCA